MERSVRQKLIAVVLLFAMTPSVSELVEWGVHALAHGDFAHAADGSHDEPAGDEHGCTPLMHACGCHRGAAATDGGSPVMAAPGSTGASIPLEPPSGRSRLADAPPRRPPIV